MHLKETLSVIAGLVMLYSFIPYARDILAGKVRPARSARIMFLLLIVISLLQQRSLGSGWIMVMTIGDGIGAAGILLLALKKGVGGLSNIDVVCYTMLGLDVALWLLTGSAVLTIHLSILADLIGMTPVLIKTWHQPWTETPLFFWLGVVGPALSIIGSQHYSYSILVFPAYICVINFVEVLIINYRQHVMPAPHHNLQLDHQPLG